MKKLYYIITAGLGITGVIDASLALAEGYPFIRRGDVQESLSAQCLTDVGNAIHSIYPTVALSKVDKWYCSSLAKTDDPQVKEFSCYGCYRVTMSDDDWYAERLAGANITPDAESTKCVNATVLNTSQKQAHAPILSSCFDGVSANDLVDFVIKREAGEIKAQANYADSVLTKSALRQLDAEVRVVRLLQPVE